MVYMSWERKKLSKHQTSQLKHLSFLVSYHRFKFNEHIRLTMLHLLLCSRLNCVGKPFLIERVELYKEKYLLHLVIVLTCIQLAVAEPLFKLSEEIASIKPNLENIMLN